MMPCIFWTSCAIIPFVSHQAIGYTKLCLDTPFPRRWCSSIPPTIYSYVQKQYWHVGFLEYWTLSQIPNFVLILPIASLIYWSGSSYLICLQDSKDRIFSRIMQPAIILPHALYTLFFTTYILSSAHAQILLRLAPSMPFLYFSAARLLLEHPRWGKVWIIWSVVWGAASVILWTTFLPPA